jgi:ABC-2 type transport system permease protein
MGTLEMLLAAPVREWELVLGKWLGGMLFVLSGLVITWIYPLLLNLLVDPGIEMGLLIAGYLGIVLFSAGIIGVGVAVSSLFNNPNAALVTNYIIVLIIWFVRPATQAGGGFVSQVVTYLNFIDHSSNFFRGILDLRDITYFLSVTALALFLGSISVESRRWR